MTARLRTALGFEGARFSPDRPRLPDPEERSRVVGYLAGAAVARLGYRTDGVWVWPETLADHARAGVGPQSQLLAHLRARGLLLPLDPPDATVAAAAAGGPPTPFPPPPATEYVAAWRVGPGGVRHRIACLIRRTSTGGDDPVDEVSTTGADWRATDLLRTPPSDRQFEPISADEAGDLLDELCASAHARALRWTLGEPEPEPEPAGEGPRLVRLFDSPDGVAVPYFAPGRLRILDPERRRRIESYLVGAAMVLRSPGLVPDPLTGSLAPVVPVNYRTDGVWVWSEALAYYLRTRGVAPRFGLLAQIEAAAYRPPEKVAPHDLAAAARAVRATAPPRRPDPDLAYYLQRAAGETGPLLRVPGRGLAIQVLRRDLRWHDSDEPDRDPRSPDHRGGYRPIDEARAAQIVDDRWHDSRAG